MLEIGLEVFAATSVFLPGVLGFVHGVWAASRLKSAEMAVTGNGNKEAALAALIHVVNVTSI